MWLEIKHRRSMWIVGIVMSLCYIVVFGVEGLYASMGLYVYYLGMSLYGWVQWGRQSQPALTGPNVQPGTEAKTGQSEMPRQPEREQQHQG